MPDNIIAKNRFQINAEHVKSKGSASRTAHVLIYATFFKCDNGMTTILPMPISHLQFLSSTPTTFTVRPLNDSIVPFFRLTHSGLVTTATSPLLILRIASTPLSSELFDPYACTLCKSQNHLHVTNKQLPIKTVK